MELTGKFIQGIRKYRYAVLVLIIGLAFMLIPFHGTEETEPTTAPIVQEQPDICEELTQILSQIDGAGKVSVMLTVRTGATSVYQYDENITSGDSGSVSRDTVIVTDENRVQSGLIQQVISPEYQGAIIVCEGADRAEVRLHIIEAVSRVTGLGTDKISVLKMK